MIFIAIILPGSNSNAELERTCKFLASSYKAMHRLPSFSSKNLPVLTIDTIVTSLRATKANLSEN